MQAIRLTYRGEEYLIPANKAFAAGAAVEEIVSLSEIAGWGDKPRFFKIASAFGCLLRFAGCQVTDADVHQDMMDGLRKAASRGVTEDIPAAMAITALMSCLMGGAPPTDPGEDAPEKPTAS